MSNIKETILNLLKKKDQTTVAQITEKTGFSRAYINRILKDLRDEGRVVLLGRANRARYVLARKDLVSKARDEVVDFQKILRNKNLAEDAVLDEVKRNTGIFRNLTGNIVHILDYAFSEMLNNAIEHSQSKTIKALIKRDKGVVRFDVIDYGIGIFKNIMKKRGLDSELEAIRDLLKGKQTTAPKEHSGEGIFFTSKVADSLVIRSSQKRLIFNNIINDIFIEDATKNVEGTRVIFSIGAHSKRKLDEIFREYSGDSYEFSKTRVAVRLYKMGAEYISRSQARRIISGLDKFGTVILDFKNVETVGQAFADEIFRVWQSRYPNIEIVAQNVNENIAFMINRASVLS